MSVVIDVGRVDNQFFCQLSGQQDGAVPFNIAHASFQTGDTVQTLGSRVYAELTQNAEIQRAIQHVIAANPQAAVVPIYINATTIKAQAVWWEALWIDPPGFLALDRRFPIARIAGTDTRRVPEIFERPFRIFAVISAEGLPGNGEWQALFNAANNARNNGFMVDLRIMTGEQALYDQLSMLNLPWISVVPTPGDLAQLDTEIGQFAPHILHFFCHGDIDAGSAWLEVLTNIDCLQIPIDKLVATPALKKVWLVVLNSCFSGASVGNLPAMAYQLVVSGNVPYAIGAMDPVQARDATTFSQAFYHRLLYVFGDSAAKAPANGALSLEWSDALHAARAAIGNQYASPVNYRQWTLPILYEHRSRLQIFKSAASPPQNGGSAARPADDAVAVRRKMVMELLATLPPDTPADIKRTLIAALLDQLNGA